MTNKSIACWIRTEAVLKPKNGKAAKAVVIGWIRTEAVLKQWHFHKKFYWGVVE